MQNVKDGWPDSYDFREDALCQQRIKPFIDTQLAALKALDAQRPKDTTYIFNEHATRVADMVSKTCLHIGLGERVAENMHWAVLPHDIGKSALPADIWDSKHKPSPELKALRRTHVTLGADIVKRDLHDVEHPFKDLMIDIMLHHHEQMDGGGPLGLEGSALSAPVRLASIVEAFDGWSIPRPHFGERDISPAGVIRRMRAEKMHMFDETLFRAFADMVLEVK